MRRLIVKCKSRRQLPLGRRDLEALSSLERTKLRALSRGIKNFCSLYRVAHQRRLKQLLKLAILQQFIEVIKIVVVEIPERPPKVVYLPRTFNSMETIFREKGDECSQQFRFHSFDCLRELKRCFRIPDGFITVGKGYKMFNEEIIMVSLTRLHYPLTWHMVKKDFPGRERWSLQAAFYWFLDFMIHEWSYLLLNNLHYWLPYLAASSEAIRIKLQNLNWISWRQFYPPAHEPGGFVICGFIDCTIYAFCRPGGVTGDGPAAFRVPQEVQEAWWTGWKKLHGLKWQSIILANGMDLQLYGPLSVRRNDLKALERSLFEENFMNLQQGQPVIFKIFGDSAYEDTDTIATGAVQAMASVRETVEWSYKDSKTLWKYCDYKHCLKIRQQPLGKIIFVSMLLRNAFITLCGSQILEYLDILPPSLENWTSQGPRARPIPQNSCFHPDFVVDDDDDDVDDDDIDSDL